MKSIILLAVSFFLLFVRSLPASDLMILTENLPSLNYVKDGVLTGYSVDVVREIQRRIGSKEKIMVYPWARAYGLALEEENVVLFSTTFTKERENLFKWICPLATKRDILVAKKGSGMTINNLEDAKKVKRIGTIRDDTKERYLIRHGFKNLESVSDEQINIKKLMVGRLDLWVHKQPGLETVCQVAGVDCNQLEEVFHLRRKDLCIAFSLQTSDEIVLKWKQAFDEMQADGTMRQIQKEWDIE